MEDNKKIKPDNFLVWAILATVMCNCAWPFGIVAIVYANKVDSLWYNEKFAEANEAAKKAKIWTFVTIGLGALGIVVGCFLGVLGLLIG